MIAGDEFYPDDVTSGPATDDEPEPCSTPIEASVEDGHWVIDRCGKPAVFDGRCAEHAA